ncbi:succinate--CoA ligase subunit beta [Phormidium sp. LEGE 05292]|uniref:succinate--CoA ligase subunit beta n=1 Tax=[Phormidium] sp. LEGE 05292 TaxID=767427 RepID=UPI00187E2103|nr:succinate--CoA ligase subunit beta [Phormidium sp. LEGE 05292]MBE9229962.1 succinate--CoA ligase subunit beta [Phormidium sp. LEGE 05292]
MDLLEYQAKELFRHICIPVLPSQKIDHPREIKSLEIPYPVVLKSQVPTGGRARAGGIKFVENTIDAIAAAQTIFRLPIMGEYPEVLLAEARYNVQQELYLAVALDYSLRRPVLLGSPKGGIDLDLVMKHLQQVIVEQEFSSFYARRLAMKMGLQGNLIQSVSAIIEKMFDLFLEKDLDLVEINPLGVSPSGELMALDGKITVNDAALARHPDLLVLAEKVNLHSNGNKGKSNGFWGLDGNIGVICNGSGLAMATLDLLYQTGGKPFGCINLGENRLPEDRSCSFSTFLQKSLEIACHQNGIKVLLINIMDGLDSCQEIADVIVSFTQNDAGGYPHFVVRLVGSNLEAAKERLAAVGITLLEQLDEAVARAVSLAKPMGKRPSSN